MRAPAGYPFHRRGGHWPSGVSCGRAMRAPTGYPFHRRGGHWPSGISCGRAMRAPTGYRCTVGAAIGRPTFLADARCAPLQDTRCTVGAAIGRPIIRRSPKGGIPGAHAGRRLWRKQAVVSLMSKEASQESSVERREATFANCWASA